tara:strand:+ start:616 stop:777 length:162 start_codon:yes stop_codon:yes gene_type:complete
MNEVEDYLFNNRGKKLGINKIYRDLSLKKRNIRRVHPSEVGSGKHTISVFTYE